LNLRPLGYEHYDARLCCLGQSPTCTVTSANAGHVLASVLIYLPRLNLFRSVSCTNPCTRPIGSPGDSGSWSLATGRASDYFSSHKDSPDEGARRAFTPWSGPSALAASLPGTSGQCARACTVPPTTAIPSGARYERHHAVPQDQASRGCSGRRHEGIRPGSRPQNRTTVIQAAATRSELRYRTADAMNPHASASVRPGP
jgi:hypothetical protein